MATSDVTAMLGEVASAYNELKDSADDALSSLTNFAQWNSAGALYNDNKGKLYLDNTYVPIQAIKSADDIITTILRLADEISSIDYNPPNSIGNFQMEDHKMWKDALADKIESNISSYIDSMGIPSSDFQNAIFNESYDRNLQVLNDLMDLADTKVGARGFTYPNGMVTAIKLDAQQKYQFDRNQVNRDVTKLVTEWARSNYQFAIEKGITFEQFHADFTYKYCTAYVDIYKNLILSSIELFKAQIGKYIEPIKALVEAAKLPIEVDKINSDISKANADLSASDNKRLIDEAIAKYNTDVQASIATFTQQIHALEVVAAQTAQFIQSASRSVIGIQK